MEGKNNFISPPEQEKKLYKARVVCSYCKKDMGEKEGFEKEGMISHGICKECFVKAEAKLGVFKRNNFSKKE